MYAVLVSMAAVGSPSHGYGDTKLGESIERHPITRVVAPSSTSPRRTMWPWLVWNALSRCAHSSMGESFSYVAMCRPLSRSGITKTIDCSSAPWQPLPRSKRPPCLGRHCDDESHLVGARDRIVRTLGRRSINGRIACSHSGSPLHIIPAPVGRRAGRYVALDLVTDEVLADAATTDRTHRDHPLARTRGLYRSRPEGRGSRAHRLGTSTSGSPTADGRCSRASSATSDSPIASP